MGLVDIQKQERLARLAEDTRMRMKRSATDIYHIGANLLEAQDLLAHGEFLPWIKAEFGMGKSSAYKFMNVAKAFQGKFPQNGNLEIAASALYLLASPSTSAKARDEVLELAEAGEVVGADTARQIIQKHKHAASDDDAPKNTELYQIPVSFVMNIVEVAYPKAWDGDTFLIGCDSARGWWDENWDRQWERYHRPRIEKFNHMAVRVNRCIWQIDNSFALADPQKDLHLAVVRLYEYGLLQMDDNRIPPAAGKDLIDWTFADDYFRDTWESVVWDAFQEKRIDILKTLGVGQLPPIERREYWHQKYRQLLAKPDINYWDWRSNPESREICPELTTLLGLLEPSPDACKVLECLAHGREPFFKPENQGQTESEIFLHVFANIGKVGKLANDKPEQKQAYRQAFAEWHLAALAQIDRDTLEQIYKVIYGANWDLIETILNPPLAGTWWEVLGVTPKASMENVKAAWKRQMKLWHPDVNSSPLAQANTIKINEAYEQFQKAHIHNFSIFKGII